MSEQEFQRLVDIVDAYFRPTVTIVDASDAVAKIKLMRPDLSDRNLAASLRISPTTMSILNRIQRASPEEKEAMRGKGVLAAYEITRMIKNKPQPDGEAIYTPFVYGVKEEEKTDDQLPPM